MHHHSMDKSPQVEVWNLTSSLCSSCLDGDYAKCHCSSNPLHKELSKDSLDQGSTPASPASVIPASAFNDDEFLSDNEFEDPVEFENTCRPLPPSTTDWDTIESVLENELQDDGDQEDSPSPDTSLSLRLKYRVKNMQMVFVDNDSDEESVPDVEVFYDDAVERSSRMSSISHISASSRMSGSSTNLCPDNERNIESRDSGYITCDNYDISIERVTDMNTSKTSNIYEPVEESSRILTSLKIHEDHEAKRRRECEIQTEHEHKRMSEMHDKNINELKAIKMLLEREISSINNELVRELMVRDELHSHHQALLMDADDLSKMQRHNLSSECTPTKKITSPKRRSFWKRN